jgi:hypothetical protein
MALTDDELIYFDLDNQIERVSRTYGYVCKCVMFKYQRGT